MIEPIDHNVGWMLNPLEESDQLDDRVVIFTSDHGEALGEYGPLLKGCRFYESLVHVPLMTSRPGRFQKGLHSWVLVDLSDLASTVLQLARLAVSGSMQNASLITILLDGRATHRHRKFVRSEYYQVLAGLQRFATVVRNQRFKQVAYHGHGIGELFDLETDPDEFNHLCENRQRLQARHDHMEIASDARRPGLFRC